MDILMIFVFISSLLTLSASIAVYVAVSRFKKEQAIFINDLRKIGYDIHVKGNEKQEDTTR